jgi:hypothetical protein
MPFWRSGTLHHRPANNTPCSNVMHVLRLILADGWKGGPPAVGLSKGLIIDSKGMECYTGPRLRGPLWTWSMPSSGKWQRVVLVRADVSEKRICLQLRVEKISEVATTLEVTSNEARSVLRLLVTANDVPSSLILFSPKMEAISSSETSVVTRTTRRHISEDNIRCSHRRDYLKSFILCTLLWSFRFHIRCVITRIGERLLVCLEGPCSL